MSYIGNQPTNVAFVTDTFSGTGTTTVFTMSVAPASTTSVLVAVTGVLQDPSTYSVSGTTLTFSAAPPSGTSNISVRYLGIPASGVTTTAYRTVTNFTATAGQTTFTPPSYTAGYIDVYRNGSKLALADFTATNGTTVVLAAGCNAGDVVETDSFYVSSVLNAIPATNNAATPYIGARGLAASQMPAGSVLQVVQGSVGGSVVTVNSNSFVTTGLAASITPTSATSKILCIVTGAVVYNSSSSRSAYLTLYRGSTNLATGSSYNQCFGQFYLDTAAGTSNVSFSYLDSPATTSSTTYTVYMASTGGAVTMNQNSNTSYIQLLEIAV